MRFTDQLHRVICLKSIPRRIVSLVPSQTELLVDLGLENAIVGITKFCTHPVHLRKSKTIVGGTKQVNIAKIISLQPDVILCNKEENTQKIVDALEDVAPVHVSDINTIEQCCELIMLYGALFEVNDRALNIISKIANERERYQHSFKSSKRFKVVYFIWKNPWMVAGSNTFINCMLKEAGFENIYESEERYPVIGIDNLELRQADILFLSSEPYPFKEAHRLELTSKFPDKVIEIIDGELFSWYGSRLLKSYGYFKSLHDRLQKKVDI